MTLKIALAIGLGLGALFATLIISAQLLSYMIQRLSMSEFWLFGAFVFFFLLATVCFIGGQMAMNERTNAEIKQIWTREAKQ